MALQYFNVNALLRRTSRHQQHLERYIGFLGTVDAVFDLNKSLDEPLPPRYWATRILLIAQTEQIQNGLYDISTTGDWGKVSQGLEVGNVVALQGDTNNYYKLAALHADKQTWKSLDLKSVPFHKSF
ncbi:hypothetical protein L1286_11175 [Pseudoalteromonas sp. SMS1]|uniref:hypothetical protein n=1 Tax=Pseudoalteromonas sp. SMS1 TaxID=2908894 RepID=UPI001F3A9CF6|nr:hypothetical protein [Pseudoalteromonas sp. SMS1]MCF2858034.1 hypothetical protein [Pseudoalteromonas sp. SMS1]